MIIDRSRVLSDHWAPSSTPKKLPSAISNKLKNEPRPISTTILRCQPDTGRRSNRAAIDLGVCSPIEAAVVAKLLPATAPAEVADYVDGETVRISVGGHASSWRLTRSSTSSRSRY